MSDPWVLNTPPDPALTQPDSDREGRGEGFLLSQKLTARNYPDRARLDLTLYPVNNSVQIFELDKQKWQHSAK